MNVYLRDTGHLLELWMMAWFWLSPILYGYMLVANKIAEHGINGNILLLNPVTPVLITFQRALYGQPNSYKTTIDPVTHQSVRQIDQHLLPDSSVWWYLRNLGFVLAGATILFLVAIKIFDKAEGNFAEVMWERKRSGDQSGL